MKYVIPVFALLLIIASCGSDPSEIDAERLVGDFFRVKDNGRGGTNNNANIGSITFRSKFCNFTYNGTPMSGKYSVDEGYVYIEAGGDLGTLSLEIINENQLEGEGLINGTFGREGFEGEMVEVSGNGKSGGNGSGGNSSSANGTSNDGGSSSAAGSSGSSNETSGGGSSAGSSSTSTNTSTNKSTSGSSSTASEPAVAKRYVVKHLNTSNMRSGASANIGLILTINAKGMVVETKLDKSKTTTNNEVLVNSVTAAVKKEVRYNEVSGSGYQRVNYLVKL